MLNLKLYELNNCNLTEKIDLYFQRDHGHTFMSKRIMLHFPLEKFYPLAILFEDAIILGAENDTILFNASSISTTNLPYCTLERSVSTISTFLLFFFL